MSKQDAERIANAGTEELKNSLLSKLIDKAPHADKLSMNHVRITFLEYVWGMTFIKPAVALLTIYGLTILIIRHRFYRHGWIRHPTIRRETSAKLAGSGSTDPANLCAELVLETTLALHYKDMKQDSYGHKIARFEFFDIPLMVLLSPTATAVNSCHESVGSASDTFRRCD